MDVEGGRGFCINDYVEPKFYLGAYHYANDRVPSANGVRAPATLEQLRRVLGRTEQLTGPCAVRYPRGGERPCPFTREEENYSFYGESGAETLLVTYGRMSAACIGVAKKAKGCAVLSLLQIRPFDPAVLEFVRGSGRILFVEEGIKTGGAGEHFETFLREAGVEKPYRILAIEDRFVPQGSVAQLLELCGLSEEAILRAVEGEKRGLESSRERAKAVIMAGIVYVNGQKSDKPGMSVPADAEIEVRGKTLPYVSRGGLKLEKGIASFGLALSGLVCMDIGASTGGFTDCMLQNGAAKVYAVDVGYGQLDWKLRCDERVVNLERTNIRYLTEERVPEMLDFASVDVSFISLKLVLPVAYRFLREGGEMLCLVKPQFEAGREKVGKKGVVRERATHLEVVEHAVAFAGEAGFGVRGLDFSPIRGPEGNIEYLMYLKKGADALPIDAAAVVDASHETLCK